MRTTLYTLAVLALASTARAEVPPGPDAINGAFARSLAHEPAALATFRPAVAPDDAFVERWVNSTARQETSSLEAGFFRMLARSHETPRPLAVHGKPDALATTIASALQAPCVPPQLVAGQPRDGFGP